MKSYWSKIKIYANSLSFFFIYKLIDLLTVLIIFYSLFVLYLLFFLFLDFNLYDFWYIFINTLEIFAMLNCNKFFCIPDYNDLKPN